ncbi:hypothetical protein [Mesoplasma photuris]|uniref:hypothetical protein n=1 Tax=Mesoplasma photuris TaxID=217731 RepID=UPI000AE7826E|nr:hypothetical protein [Mesoplasma photuris]
MPNDTRTWVAAYNKYLDELTDAEWMEMSNAQCDSPLSSCSNNLEQILEEQESRRNKNK